ncbi:MAG: DUF6576 domain-containing protein [Phycisphaerales bacterium]
MRNGGQRDWGAGQTAGGGGGWSRVWRRLVDNPENPIGWSLFMFRVFGITVRIHLFTVVYLLLLPLSALSPNAPGIHFLLPLVISLFVVVLLHEFGHCFACRWVGGEADRIVLLPFGGLALCQSPHDWRSNLITTVGGPGVNVALFPLTAGLMFVAGMPGWIVFNPLNAYGPFLDGTLSWGGTAAAIGKAGVWWLHYTNVLIFGFNMLMVMYPFDAGRIVHALMWRKMGYRRASGIAATIGLFGAMVVGAVALVIGNMLLLAIAAFGGMTCWFERKRARGEVEIAMGSLGSGAEAGGYNPFAVSGDDDDDVLRTSKREMKRLEAEQKQQEDVDRILEKIAREGMGSLTGKEKKVLERASKGGRKR